MSKYSSVVTEFMNWIDRLITRQEKEILMKDPELSQWLEEQLRAILDDPHEYLGRFGLEFEFPSVYCPNLAITSDYVRSSMRVPYKWNRGETNWKLVVDSDVKSYFTLLVLDQLRDIMYTKYPRLLERYKESTSHGA